MSKAQGQGGWSHEVVVLLPERVQPGRGPAAVEPLGPALQALLEDGKAESVFQASRQVHAASVRMPSIYAVKTLGDAETRDILEMLTEDMEAATVYVAPPRGVLGRHVGGDAGSNSKAMDHWGMDYVAAELATADASGIAVAVVDTGVDRSHPDLKDAIDEYINFCQGESDDDIHGHGTHVCGIIAATGLPPQGMKGASNARLHVFKGMGIKYSALDYYRALGEAIGSAQIINLSLGGVHHDPAEEVIIQQGLNKGALVIAASGNEGDDGSCPNYPANLAGVIAVGAIDEKGARAEFSNAGPHVMVVAPGVEIWSTAPTKKCSLFKKQLSYAPCSGTSMATPFVTALAAKVAASGGGTPLAQTIRDKLPIQRCPGQVGKTDDLGYGYVCWGGPLTLANA
ncbi:S8 family peptidase [Roseateles cellulosilyticus]|uniref:S8 family serine peptidase n=1 Tax=Pelomonas cellulosilytica TaxID=2906762 RepID=A0ABS8XZN8_9BURK|nr:S8 family serine peptidase [Pelomonas sp. P8]MCE4558069.1 S8 family serine peptidase [Pelomonas sp. P8]